MDWQPQNSDPENPEDDGEASGTIHVAPSAPEQPAEQAEQPAGASGTSGTSGATQSLYSERKGIKADAETPSRNVFGENIHEPATYKEAMASPSHRRQWARQ